MGRRRVFVAEAQENVFSADSLIVEHIKLRLGPVIRSLFFLNVYFFFSPNVSLIFCNGLFSFLLLFNGGTTRNLPVVGLDVHFYKWLCKLLLLTSVVERPWVQGGAIDVTVVLFALSLVENA